ncbi:uncharacterized protein LOC129921409 isoform X2 [Episyrphus balteatus]|uniref:uncharacterized protein LOC129921409 isoform X2 n=1 Tax=Episyrphus balteatus TaxID=286459 RepID=UPI0024854701|nr:uncharacterized protein LOC129921409 isoform X2 [Episyrphus balteatus]
MEHRWVHSTPHVPLPPFAVVGGHDCDGSPIYVGRSYHEGDNLPAKVVPSKHTAYVCWGGREITKSHFEILTGNHYRWIPCAAGSVPPNAVLAGNTCTGEPLYVGRGHWEGSLTVGKIHPSHHCLYIPFGGEERRLDCYEVLVYEMSHSWQHGSSNYMPPGGVVAGHDTDGSTIYVGRAHNDGQSWVSTSAHAPMPPLAVVGGHDVDGSTIYVGRTFHEGDMLTAKVIPSKRTAYVSWQGQEIPKTHFEVLCGSHYVWRPCYDHIIPLNAVECGRTRSGQRVIVGRGHFEGSLTVGKVMTVHRALFIPFGGCERRLDSYEILVKETPIPGPTWVSSTGCNVPANAVYAGHDTDSATIYVGRAFHNGDLLPAKVIPNKSCAYICHGGCEIVKDHFEVLTGFGYRWVPAADGFVPPGAVEGGRTVQGEPLFIGRANYCGSLTPGKIQKSHGCLYIPFAGQERRVVSYEVLVGNDAPPMPGAYPVLPPPYTKHDDDEHHHHHHHHHHPSPSPPPPYNPGFGFKIKF